MKGITGPRARGLSREKKKALRLRGEAKVLIKKKKVERGDEGTSERGGGRETLSIFPAKGLP